MPKVATSYFIPKSLSVAEMLKLGKTIKKTSTSSQLKTSTWRQWFGHVADLLKQSIINPCPRFPRLEKFNLTCDLSLWHAKVMEGFARKTLIHTSTQGRGTPPRTPWFIFTGAKQLMVGIAGLKCFLRITYRVLTWLTIQLFSGSWRLSILTRS